MEIEFKVAGRIDRPVSEVFEAVVDPDQLSEFFTTGGAKGRLAAGATVTWDFADFPGAFPVEVVEVVDRQRIVLRWDAPPDEEGGAGYATTVTITFEPLTEARTLVTISESGWHDTDAGRRASYGNCEGWAGVLCCMKAWLDHGIHLRQGFYA